MTLFPRFSGIDTIMTRTEYYKTTKLISKKKLRSDDEVMAFSTEKMKWMSLGWAPPGGSFHVDKIETRELLLTIVLLELAESHHHRNTYIITEY